MHQQRSFRTRMQDWNGTPDGMQSCCPRPLPVEGTDEANTGIQLKLMDCGNGNRDLEKTGEFKFLADAFSRYTRTNERTNERNADATCRACHAATPGNFPFSERRSSQQGGSTSRRPMLRILFRGTRQHRISHTASPRAGPRGPAGEGNKTNRRSRWAGKIIITTNRVPRRVYEDKAINSQCDGSYNPDEQIHVYYFH